MGMDNTIDVKKPKKYGILIKLNLDKLANNSIADKEVVDKLIEDTSHTIASRLRLNAGDTYNMTQSLLESNRALVGDYYYDIAQSKLFKLMHSIQMETPDVSDKIYAKVEGKANER